MREVISVHVGQAGVQIGNACCELFFQLQPSFCHRHERRDGRRALPCFYRQNIPYEKWRDADPINPGELYTVEHGLSVSLPPL